MCSIANYCPKPSFGQPWNPNHLRFNRGFHASVTPISSSSLLPSCLYSSSSPRMLSFNVYTGIPYHLNYMPPPIQDPLTLASRKRNSTSFLVLSFMGNQLMMELTTWITISHNAPLIWLSSQPPPLFFLNFMCHFDQYFWPNSSFSPVTFQKIFERKSQGYFFGVFFLKSVYSNSIPIHCSLFDCL